MVKHAESCFFTFVVAIMCNNNGFITPCTSRMVKCADLSDYCFFAFVSI